MTGYEYLEDLEFLDKLYKAKTRTTFIKLVLLTFDEKTIKDIQGIATSGSISVNGNSTIRRTINLSMAAAADQNDLTNLENQIALDKKIRVEVGLKNPFPHSKYPDVIWFPVGLYIITSANLSYGTGGCNISITGKDKMGKLDGSIGGTLPASITFHEAYIEDEIDGEKTIRTEYPTIYTILVQALSEYGEEDLQNIFIEDIDEKAKFLIKYVGSDPIYFSQDYSSFQWEYDGESHPIKVVTGQNIGYRETDFTFPGELVLGAGETVATLLDKIAKALGNYEYFYDVWGKFHFQEIKNYMNTRSPIDADGILTDNYMQSYGNAQYDLSDNSIITQISFNPKYENIKNDFIVWGSKNSTDDITIPIRYHVAIDEKPSLEVITEIANAEDPKFEDMVERYPEPRPPIEIPKPTEPNKDDYATSQAYNDAYARYLVDNEKYEAYIGNKEKYNLDHKAWKDNEEAHAIKNLKKFYTTFLNKVPWQEELYMRAMRKKRDGVDDAFYDAELIAEWRNVYNPNTFFAWAAADNIEEYQDKSYFQYQEQIHYVIDTKDELVKDHYGRTYKDVDPSFEWPLEKKENQTEADFEKQKENYRQKMGNAYVSAWNPAVYEDPAQIVYWLDFIDRPDYSVNAIGRRSKVKTDDKIGALWRPEIPPVIFVKQGDELDEASLANGGYQCFYLNDNEQALFSESASGATALDEIRALIQTHLIYNNSISLTCLPMYHIEPNGLAYIYNKKSGVNGNYQLTQFTIPLAYNGTMSITATEVQTKY